MWWRRTWGKCPAILHAFRDRHPDGLRVLRHRPRRRRGRRGLRYDVGSVKSHRPTVRALAVEDATRGWVRPDLCTDALSTDGGHQRCGQSLRQGPLVAAASCRSVWRPANRNEREQSPGWGGKERGHPGRRQQGEPGQGKEPLQSGDHRQNSMTASPTQLGTRTRMRRTTSGSRVNRRDTWSCGTAAGPRGAGADRFPRRGFFLTTLVIRPACPWEASALSSMAVR